VPKDIAGVDITLHLHPFSSPRFTSFPNITFTFTYHSLILPLIKAEERESHDVTIQEEKSWKSLSHEYP
jgi:hypothetical protein